MGGVPNWNRKLAAGAWWHQMELPGESIEGVRSAAEMRASLALFGLPDSLAGMRALDVGAWDGWFSFELERRGAEVVAVDCWDNPRFRCAARRLNSRVRYEIADVYDLSPRTLGHFDIVLFLGVVYHLKHPLLALERVCAMSADLVCVESFVTGGKPDGRPAMEFYETGELAGQTDNWTGPNTACLLAFCRTAGFARAELRGVRDGRAHVTCRRRFPAAPAAPRVPAPELVEAAHNTRGGINFDSRRDEYVSCWFRHPAARLGRAEVMPEVAGWGSIPLMVQRAGELWQANFKLPPGLHAGWHEFRLRLSGSGASNALRLAVDVPVETCTLSIAGACDGITWDPAAVTSGVASLWVDGLPENADRVNVRVRVGDADAPVEWVAPPGGGSRQVNARIPAMAAGTYDLVVICAGCESPVRPLRLANPSPPRGNI